MRPRDCIIYFRGGPWDGRSQYFKGLAPDDWYVAETLDPPTAEGYESPNAASAVYRKHRYQLNLHPFRFSYEYAGLD